MLMATISNRSRYFVSVAKCDHLYKEFPYSALAKANAYLALLRQEGYRSARLGQHTNKIQVRVRHKGFPDQIITMNSLEAAEQLLLRIQAERASGLLIDYSSARRVTMAQLVERYLKEECPKHKGGQIEGYTLRGMLADSRGELERALKERASGDCNGRKTPQNRARRAPRRALEWFHKPFADVVPTDIEEFIENRLEQVSPATVDREIDLIAAVINLAIRTWRVRVPQSPLDGVRRPKYFNERDRRLRGDEESRLLKAARDEDLERSLAPVVEEALQPARKAAEQLKNPTARKRFIAEARREIEERLRPAVVVTPVFENLLTFLLATAARRGEALKLEWLDIDWNAPSALFRETKNGRPRTVPLRDCVVEALDALPRSQSRVFPVTLDELKGAWDRIRSRAGIEDLHLHDLRHEAISRIAENAHLAGAPITLIELAAMSGHRDLRMLARYAHICARNLARRLDQAFAKAAETDAGIHKGRTRLGGRDGMKLAEVHRATVQSASVHDNVIKFPERHVRQTP
jgi:integrase